MNSFQGAPKGGRCCSGWGRLCWAFVMVRATYICSTKGFLTHWISTVGRGSEAASTDLHSAGKDPALPPHQTKIFILPSCFRPSSTQLKDVGVITAHRRALR